MYALNLEHRDRPAYSTFLSGRALRNSSYRSFTSIHSLNMRRDSLYRNPLVLTDVYNLGHQGMKIDTRWEVSHIYNRKAGQILFGFHDATTNFLKSIKISQEMIDEAEAVAEGFGVVFPSSLFRDVIDKCDGRVPLQIETLPDGTFCPAGTPFAQISNTVEGFGELVTWWEGIFLHSHFSTSCATEAWHMRRYLEHTRNKFHYPETFLKRFHSFSFRSHRSLEDAFQAGSAWALFLTGSDDFHIGLHRPDVGLSSIPALAHKVVSQFDDEDDSFKRAIDYAAESHSNIVALVIDTYDAYKVINHKIPMLSEYAAQRGVDIIARPDSGNTWKQVVDIYDVVKENDLQNVKAIIGEGMSLSEAKKADHFFQINNVPLDFVSYGIGSGFYKHLDRDTLGWACKTAFSNGGPRMKFSENPMKRSIPGRVGLIMKDGEMWVGNEAEVADSENLYRISYHHDSKQENMPSQTWRQIRSRGLSANFSQIFIKSTPTIKSMVRHFRQKYRQA